MDLLAIAYVVHVKTPGHFGGEARSYQVALALAQNSLQVDLYGAVDVAGDWPRGVNPVRLQGPFPLGIFQLWHRFRQQRPVISIERYQFPLFNVAFWTQYWRRQPILMEVHGFPIDEFQLMQKDISINKVDKITWLMSKIPTSLLERVQAFIFRRVTHFIVTSYGTKAILGQLGVPASKVTVIYNSVDADKFNPALYDKETARRAFNVPVGRPIVLYAGSFHEELLTVLQAVKNVVTQNKEIFFIFVSSGDTTLVNNRLKELGLTEENILLREAVDHHEMPKLLATANVILAPYTLNSERFKKAFHYSPLKVMEALAMGKKVITVNADELLTVFDGVSNVEFAQAGSVVSWGEEILLAIDCQDDKDLGEGRAFILDGYQWADVGRKYRQLIEKFMVGGATDE
ncbi:MAG TPA: glycosyltransferase family 4 protein [Anaerolineae bacterium]|nr:glycosyltransferase family 4 protein [Anaerolineae bacterium]